MYKLGNSIGVIWTGKEAGEYYILVARVVVAFLLSHCNLQLFLRRLDLKLQAVNWSSPWYHEVAKIWTDLKRQDSTFFATQFMYFNTWRDSKDSTQDDSYYEINMRLKRILNAFRDLNKVYFHMIRNYKSDYLPVRWRSGNFRIKIWRQNI